MDKYVGESDSSELEECLMNPETRIIQQITVENIDKANEMFEIFMGTKVEPRRKYILEHSEEAIDFE